MKPFSGFCRNLKEFFLVLTEKSCIMPDDSYLGWSYEETDKSPGRRVVACATLSVYSLGLCSIDQHQTAHSLLIIWCQEIFEDVWFQVQDSSFHLWLPEYWTWALFSSRIPCPFCLIIWDLPVSPHDSSRKSGTILVSPQSRWKFSEQFVGGKKAVPRCVLEFTLMQEGQMGQVPEPFSFPVCFCGPGSHFAVDHTASYFLSLGFLWHLGLRGLVVFFHSTLLFLQKYL